MRKNVLYKGIALSLATAQILTSQPVSAATEKTEIPITASSLAKTSGLYNDGTYYYATVNMPYADFYYGELNKTAPVGTVSLTASDPVSNYREDGQYDAVSSATTVKSTKFGATYYEASDSGVNILGIKDVQVAIPIALYDDILAHQEQEASCENKLYDFFHELTFSDSAFSEYKIMSGDGTFSAMTTAPSASYDAAVTVSDAKAVITTDSRWGNYQIDIEGINVDSKTMLGALIETTDGSVYGMEHLENLWLKTAEMSFATQAFKEVTGNTVDYLRHATLPGKTISKITYLVKDGSDVVVPVNLPVKYLISDEDKKQISITSIPLNKNGMTASYVNGLAASKSHDGILSSIQYNGTDLDTGLYSYNSSLNTITLDGSLKPGPSLPFSQMICMRM